MAEIALMTGVQNTISDTIETLYSAPPKNDVLITAFSASNDSGGNQYYIAYIYDANGLSNGAVVPRRIVVIDDTNQPPGAIGQIVPAGGTIRLLSSNAPSITFWATGEEIG